jgi:modulator of FtsH protease HflK
MTNDDDFDPPLVSAEHIERWRTWFRSATRYRRVRESASGGSPIFRKRLTTFKPRQLLHSVLAAGLLIVVVWASSGFYKVQPDQRSIVVRFGRWVGTREPGLNYHLPYPIEDDLLIRITQLNQVRFWNGAVTQVLTGDENILEVSASASWRIVDVGKYVFGGRDPKETVRIAGETAIRQVIALNPMQSAVSDNRQKIADDAQALLQTILDSDETGIEVVQIQLERVDPPAAVIDAFNDVQRARADQERARNEAEAYSNDILPRARGEAARMLEEAKAYEQSTLNQAESEAQRYLDMRQSYLGFPKATVQRLYFDTMEEVLKSSGKILLEPSSGSPSHILPFVNLNAVGATQKDQP